MRIVVNDIAAETGGALTVLKSFYNYIRDCDDGNEYIFLLSGNFIEETDNIKVIVREDVKKSGLHKLWFDFISGSKFISALNPDYALSLQNIITFGLKCRQGVYVHQSIPFQKVKKFSLIKGAERGTAIIQRFIGSIIRKSVRKADDVFVQTEWMKRNVAEMSKVSSDKITVVPFEVELPEDEARTTACPRNSFFYPATAESIYKNHQVIYDALDILNSEGIGDFEVKLTLPKDIPAKRENVEHVGMLDKKSLYDEYRNSILLFPSYIETIGLPLIEARSVNAVIFAADCEYSREVVGDYANAYFFDQFNPAELADLMKSAVNGEIILKEDYYVAGEKSGWKVLKDRIAE